MAEAGLMIGSGSLGQSLSDDMIDMDNKQSMTIMTGRE